MGILLVWESQRRGRSFPLFPRISNVSRHISSCLSTYFLCHEFIHILHIHIYTLSLVYTYVIFIHTFIYTFILTYVHTFIHTYISTYVYMYVYIYVHAYVYTYITKEEKRNIINTLTYFYLKNSFATTNYISLNYISSIHFIMSNT